MAAEEDTNKRKAEDTVEETPNKEAKTEENTSPTATALTAASAEMDTSQEVDSAHTKREVEETDDKPDSRSLLKATVGFDVSDTTINVVATAGGRVLMSLSDGGMQYLIAGARANVGVTAGRYLYEVKIVESLTVADAPPRAGKPPIQKNLLRIGFSISGSSLVLGEGDGGVCFDGEGHFRTTDNKDEEKKPFARDQVLAVLLNLDPSSPHANTVSLFKNGQRVTEPQPIPEHMQGKPLFPHVAFRSCSVQVNFGKKPLAPLPFVCRTLQEAATKDVDVRSVPKPKDGKYEVLFPICVPDQGSFDWLDDFLKNNPQYTELSERAIIDWALKSGLWKPKANQGAKNSSNDRPDMAFGIPCMDDGSIRRTLYSMAPVMGRNYIIMEVKGNLMKAERKEALKRFCAPHFRRVAQVVMGKPSQEYKTKVQALHLAEKQAKATQEWTAKKAASEKKKQALLRHKQLLEETKKDDDAGEKNADDKKEEAVEEELEGEEPEPVVSLSEEEENTVWFRQGGPLKDMTAQALNAAYPQFTVPDGDEGFDAVSFEWQKEALAKDHLKQWIIKNKRTMRIEDLQPSEWFKQQHAEGQKLFSEWHHKQADFKERPPVAPKKVIKKKKDANADVVEVVGDEKKEGSGRERMVMRRRRRWLRTRTTRKKQARAWTR